MTNTEAQELIKKCKKALETKVDKSFIDAQNLYNNKNYEQAFYTLYRFVGDSTDFLIKDIKLYNYNGIVELYNKSEKEFASICLSKGKKLYTEGDYQQALTKLSFAQYSSKNANLKAMQEEASKYIALINEKLEASQASSAPLTSYNSNTPPTIGMSSEEVKNSSWGYPQSKNITKTANGTNEQWVYKNNEYIYFDNNIVTAISTH